MKGILKDSVTDTLKISIIYIDETISLELKLQKVMKCNFFLDFGDINMESGSLAQLKTLCKKSFQSQKRLHSQMLSICHQKPSNSQNSIIPLHHHPDNNAQAQFEYRLTKPFNSF